MVITRKSTQYDIEHGGNFNKEFTDKGVTFYTEEEGTNHSDKMENDETFWFDKSEVDEEDPNGEWNSKKLWVKNVHVTNDQEIDNDLTVDGNTHLIGKPGNHDEPALVVDNNTRLKGQTEEDEEGNVSYVGDALTVEGKSKFEEDVQMDKKLHVDGETTIDDNFFVNGTATITGDLYVKGTAFEEHATDLNVGADFVTLREGATAGLDTGERSGVIINKYDGVDSLGIITDAHGTLRIGEFNTVKVYTDDDTTFYSDRELTTETTLPAGAKLYQVGETDPETGLKEYYYVAKDDTEPVATRGISDEMEDQYLTKWDADGEDIVTSNTNEKRVIDTEVRSKNVEARVEDLEAGKLNIDVSNKYPVVIDRTDGEEYKQTNTVSAYLTRTAKKVESDVEYTYYDSDRAFFIKQETSPDPTYIEITNYRSYIDGADLVYEYSTDNGATFTSLEGVDVYYSVGNENSNNYNWSLTADNVIRYFDSVDKFEEEKEASLDGTSDNPLEEENIVMIKNVFSLTDDVQTDRDLPTGAPLTIVDYAQVGNYNAITSNAVSKMMSSAGEQFIDNVTIKSTEPTYNEEAGDSNIVYLNNFNTETHLPLDDHEIYLKFDEEYYRVTQAEETDTEVVFTCMTFDTPKVLTVTKGSLMTYYHVGQPGKIYAVIDTALNNTSALPVQNRVINAALKDQSDRITEIRDLLPTDLDADEKIVTTKMAFDVIYPVGSIYLSLSSTPPANGTWTLRTRLDGPVGSNTNVYFWERLS